jgi:hypothetical protein
MVPPGPGSDAPFDRGASPDDSPFPPRPYPTRPYPTRPYPTRPYPTRPYPTRAYGAAEPALRPYPTRPYPTRPYPTRPYPTRDDAEARVDAPDPGLDADEWTADVSELFLARSAVVRMGATVVAGVGYVPVPRAMQPEPDYLPRKVPSSDPDQDEETDPTKPLTGVEVRALVPRRLELGWTVAVPDDLVRDLSEQPEPAWALKEDIATALAQRADRQFLTGGAFPPPEGAAEPANAAVRAILTAIRGIADGAFEYAGWILSAATLDLLAATPAGPRTWDSTRLVMPDGSDGGSLLGYPFVLSAAADDVIYFSADWSQLWIGVERRPVTVAISEHLRFDVDETVIRAVSQHDAVNRRRELFKAATVGPQAA